eukprot:CAMPEP_0197660648 /NCGR_PEP_ID=MMETSP1338-20131121/50976_1 /TAXON_ID=43686 ORGANISM="Pelagodinium beii, Strain RCC1491" /NCGR_SAMPLE_ID=MMETSP1338 /ASSEMBLY_ACC=CAM_ASM_000754 /LENGTH=78 /DNA_ID=CAMNT_0043238043 /DNA_START=1 /DNA_END=233 /DNA_ORIENTATION=+
MTHAQLPANLGRILMSFLCIPRPRCPVSAGCSHTAAIDAAGKLHCFGWNNAGQCNVPDGIGEAIQVSAGRFHTAAIDA